LFDTIENNLAPIEEIVSQDLAKLAIISPKSRTIVKLFPVSNQSTRPYFPTQI
jgi:hypothetical protein